MAPDTAPRRRRDGAKRAPRCCAEIELIQRPNSARNALGTTHDSRTKSAWNSARKRARNSSRIALVTALDITLDEAFDIALDIAHGIAINTAPKPAPKWRPMRRRNGAR